MLGTITTLGVFVIHSSDGFVGCCNADMIPSSDGVCWLLQC